MVCIVMTQMVLTIYLNDANCISLTYMKNEVIKDILTI